MYTFTIQRAAMGRGQCYLTREALPANRKYSVCADGFEISRDAAVANAPPGLVGLLDQIIAGVDPSRDDSIIGIARTSDLKRNSLCPLAKAMFGVPYEPITPRRGEWDLAAGLARGEDPVAVSERAAIRVAPALVTFLRDGVFHSPVLSALETPAEKRGREGREATEGAEAKTQQQRKANEVAIRECLRRIAAAMVGHDPDRGDIERAEQLADGLKSYFERQKHLS